jgi:RNA polymerase sigma-70 factor (ECF subfamily)
MMIRAIKLDQTVWTIDPLQTISDAELVEHIHASMDNPSSGRDAVCELYDRYNKPIFRYLWARVSDRQLAEDLTGEVFARMVAALPRYRIAGGTFQAWLYRIAHNLLIDQYRKERGKNEISLDDVEYIGMAADDPEQATEQVLFIERVMTGLKKLDSNQQEILILRFISGLSLQEVAATLGKTVGAVKIAQHRALKELRGLLNVEESEVNHE